MRLDIADHPSAAMEEDQRTKRTGPGGRVYAHGDIAGRTGDTAILRLRRFLGITAKGREHRLDRRARLGWRHCMKWFAAGGCRLIEDCFHLGVELHNRLLSRRMIGCKM